MRNRWFGCASCSRDLVFLDGGTLQAESAENWCSQRGTLQTTMPNEATDGLAPSVLDYFFGCSTHGFLRVSAGERGGTTGSYSHYFPEALCCRKGTMQAQGGVDWCSPKGTLHT